jgi:hypothetical protein
MVAFRGQRQSERQYASDRLIPVPHHHLFALADKLQVGGELVLQNADVHSSHGIILL